MVEISYTFVLALITVAWCLTRVLIVIKKQQIIWPNEFKLFLMYLCTVFIVRFTFFPFSEVNGVVQPLVFNRENLFPPRFNLIPFVNLFNYPNIGEAVINVVGNVVLFIPAGAVFPTVFRQINSIIKAMFTGFIFSLCVEILQLPFYGRVSDVDDLLMNTLGFGIGYAVYVGVKGLKNKRRSH